jgi:hypothetical protein
MSPAEVAANPKRANDVAREKAKDNLRMVHLPEGNLDDIEREIEDFQPTTLVINQIRNLRGKADGMTQQLEANAIVVRRLIATYGLVGLSITQAGDSASGKLWLDLSDIDSSKTGLPAQGDLIIGIGATNDMLQRNQRGLSLPKNKLSSEPNAHEGVIVDIDKSRAKFI